MKRKVAAAALAGLMGIAIMSAAPAQADQAGETPSESESQEAIEEVTPEVFDNLHEDIIASDSEATAEIDPGGDQTERMTVSLEASSSSIEVDPTDGSAVTMSLVQATGAETPADITNEGTLFADHASGISSTAVVKEDGSVQVVSTIAEGTTTQEIPYEFDAEGLSYIQESDDGALFLRAADGSLLGGVAPAWAKDANGVEVPTHYEVTGTQVVQVVEHLAGDFQYPVVADPFWGTNLFDYVRWINGVHVLKPSGWNRAIRMGAVNTPQAPNIGLSIIMADGWNEFANRSPGRYNINHSTRQQYYCHAVYGIDVLTNPTWDLEPYRPSLPKENWHEVFRHKCNWNYSNGNP
ncbi:MULTISPECIES: DUF2599 domain-containing protein [unclassified Pseudoclavibacter]|uniref:DUF2599 domain-containing protein n=1 Tax=unclassified Pseudoclavibacter TaxID=2615177 RepID=UPI001BA61FB5|nr:DUF2599 domain-containing protein [Pseudoclavibacter sp. Marseille-Q4354]MBS3180551.1 DUF2599 domain-containing protein [Pseudoclavibacter sp. Marseille-Q4354]